MEDENPIISIVITTYKRTYRLKDAIESALNQSYRKKEIIVVDDNANQPEYREWVTQFMNIHPEIRYIKNEKNIGGALARNVGIKAAKGEFIVFLDDDDTCKDNRVQKQYECFKSHRENNVGMIYCYATRVDSTGKQIGVIKGELEENPIYQHMLGCIAGTSLWFCNKKVLLDVGMFEDTPCKQDSIMLLKILAKDYNVYRVPEFLVNYTEHNEGRISGIKPENITGICNFRKWCRKFYTKVTVAQRRNVEYQFSKELLTIYILNNERAKAFCELKTMSKIAPFKIDTAKSIIKCVFPTLYIKALKKLENKRFCDL